MAPDRAYGAGNAPCALAPPAISKASAAGTGNPIASRNTAANRITKPCAARFEIQESMTVRVLLCFETSDWASLRLYRQRLYGSILLVRTLKTVIRRLRGSAPGSSLRCIDGGQQDHLRGCEAEARS